MLVRNRGSFACDLLPDSRQCCPGRHDEPQQLQQLQPAAWETECQAGQTVACQVEQNADPLRAGAVLTVRPKLILLYWKCP